MKQSRTCPAARRPRDSCWHHPATPRAGQWIYGATAGAPRPRWPWENVAIGRPQLFEGIDGRGSSSRIVARGGARRPYLASTGAWRTYASACCGPAPRTRLRRGLAAPRPVLGGIAEHAAVETAPIGANGNPVLVDVDCRVHASTPVRSPSGASDVVTKSLGVSPHHFRDVYARPIYAYAKVRHCLQAVTPHLQESAAECTQPLAVPGNGVSAGDAQHEAEHDEEGPWRGGRW